MKIKIKRIEKDLPLPEYQTKGAVAFDLYSRVNMVIKPKSLERLPTNIIIEIPEGYMLEIKDRSSTLKRKGLLVSTGYIDNDQFRVCQSITGSGLGNVILIIRLCNLFKYVCDVLAGDLSCGYDHFHSVVHRH